MRTTRFYSGIAIATFLLLAQNTQAELVAHWPLNEGSGDVFADVIGGFDGFLPIAEFEEQTEIEWGDGPPTQDHAVDFLGVNSFIATGFPGIEGDNARTVSFWFRTESESAYFLAWGANAASEKWHIRLNGGSGVMRTEFQGGQNFATTPLNDGDWHFVASVFPDGASEGEEILHYIDGELDEWAGGTSLPIETTVSDDDDFDWTDANSAEPYPVHFGSVLAHGFGRMLDGSMADIRIYDEELSQQQLIDIMEGRDPGGVINDPLIRLNDGSLTDADERVDYVHNVLNTWMGDSNHDGEFNSSDFVTVFSAGKFETGLAATWEEGDWNGDMVFDSSDFVVAFVDGGYETGPRPANVVPEPSSQLISFFALALVAVFKRRKNN